jgi:hypothetical protein
MTFRHNDVVVTPSGRRAMVKRQEADGRWEVCYIDLKTACPEFVVLPGHLLRRVERGIVPAPVRLLAGR